MRRVLWVTPIPPRFEAGGGGEIRQAHLLSALAERFDHVLLVTGESSRYGANYLARALRLLRTQFSSLSIEVQPRTPHAATTSPLLLACMINSVEIRCLTVSSLSPSG